MREPSPVDEHTTDFSEPEILGGRYVLGEELGVGATARVYQAWDSVLSVSRAVKLLSVPDSYRDALRQRLRAEARAMARLNHPNVLRVYDISTIHDDDFVVMELAEGGSLQALVDAEGALPVELACDYILQILSALGAAHRAGVVHRDVKPQNILLNVEGQALLADFGIALLEDADRHTRTGAAMGSLSYMAPEQRVDARQVGPAADIYATGATLYHLLTAANPIDLFASPSFSPRWTALSRRLRPIVQRATAYEPTSRYPSAEAMALDLRAALLAESDSEHTDEVGVTFDEERTLPPEAYAELGRDPSTLFELPHGLRAGRLELPHQREQREALYALPLTLGGLLVGLACWFLWPSFLPHAPTMAHLAAPQDDGVSVAGPADPQADAAPGPADAQADAAPAPTSPSGTRGARPAVLAATAMGAVAEAPLQSSGALLANGKPQVPWGSADVATPSPAAGRWQGRLGGHEIELHLSGITDLQGALVVSGQEKTDAAARYDSTRRTLRVELRLPENWPEVSAGELRLAGDAQTLAGRVQVAGQTRMVRLQRVP